MKKEIAAMLVDAIEKAVQEIDASIGIESLHGFALVTDNEAGIVYPCACAKGEVAYHQETHRYIGVSFNDWRMEAGDKYFEPISSRLEKHAQGSMKKAGDLASVRGRFEQLVLALESCRKSKLFSDDVMLACGSDDPDDEMHGLSLDAVERLNTAATVEEYRDFLAFAYKYGDDRG